MERKSKSLQQTKKQREKAEKKRLRNKVSCGVFPSAVDADRSATLLRFCHLSSFKKRKEKKMLEKLEKMDQDSDKTEVAGSHLFRELKIKK